MPKNQITALAICKMDCAHIPEWITYHRLIGVDKFILVSYDKDPKIVAEMKRLSQKYNFDIHFKDFAWGSKLYNGMIEMLQPLTRWCAFIDIDEFIYLPTGDLPTLLSQYEDYGALSMSWRCYGSSGIMTPQPLTIDAYRYRAKDSFRPNAHQKIISQIRFCKQFRSPHWARHVRPVVDSDYNRINGVMKSGCPIRSVDKIRVNHYLLKSREDFKQKVKRASDVGICHAYWESHEHNDVYDDGICRYVPQIMDELDRY